MSSHQKENVESAGSLEANALQAQSSACRVADPVAPDVALPAEHHLTTVRTARYFTLGAPLAETKRVWFALHGYAQLAARFLRHFKGIVPADTLIVAPEALSRFYLELPRTDRRHMERVGAAWMTREDRLADIADTRAFLDSVYRTVMDEVTRATGSAPEVTVLAFSQSVAIAMRWIAGGVVNPARVIMWAGSLANDVNPDEFRAGLGEAEVILVAGEFDQFLTEKARATIFGQWEALNITPREIVYADGVHEVKPAVLVELFELGRQ